MPLQRRLPKRGFVSLQRDDTAEVRLSDLQKVSGDSIDLAVLKEAGVVPSYCSRAKVILAGEIRRKIALTGLLVSKGARSAIEARAASVECPRPLFRPRHAAPGRGAPGDKGRGDTTLNSRGRTTRCEPSRMGT